MIRRVAHVCLFSRDLEASVDFYVNKLGLEKKFGLKNKEGREFGCYLAAGGQTFLEIFDAEAACAEWGDSTSGMQTPGRLRHFCLEVEDVDALAARLAEQGVSVTNICNGLDGSRQGWVTDPDGNPVELMHYTPQSLQLQ